MSILYTVGIHKGLNLPKADRFGKIDGYVKVYVDGAKLGKTKIINKDFNPVWKSYFCFHSDNPTPQIKLVLMDYDAVGKNDYCGEIVMDPTSIPCAKLPVHLNNVPAGMIHSKEIPTLVVSVGKCISYLGAKARFGSMPGALFDDSKQKLGIPIAAGVPIYYCIEYENTKKANDKADLEISLICTDPKWAEKGYVDFSWAGRKYSIKKKATKDLSSFDKFCGQSIYSNVSLPDMKIHKLVYGNDLLIRWGTYVVDEKLDIDAITSKHGWSGAMGYAACKAKLKGVEFDDKHEHVYFKTKYGMIVVDFDKNNTDFFYMMDVASVAKGLIPDAVVKSNPKRTISFNPVTYEMNKQNFGMKAVIDDIPFGTYLRDISMFTYAVTITGMAPIFSLFPIATF